MSTGLQQSEEIKANVKADAGPEKGFLRHDKSNISVPSPTKAPSTSPDQPQRHLLSASVLPSSWAVVKAEGSPSSSMTEQLLLGSHMVPTSAMPRVSQVVAPHRSCQVEEKQSQAKVKDGNRRDPKKRKGILRALPLPSRPRSFSQIFLAKVSWAYSWNQPRLKEVAPRRKFCGSLRRPYPTQGSTVGGN